MDLIVETDIGRDPDDFLARRQQEPALLASRRELEKLLRALANQEPLPDRFLGWRKAVITDALLGLEG